MYNVTAKCHTPPWLESGEICTSCRRDFKFTFEKSPSRETEAKRRCTSANFSAALTARRSNPWKSCVNPPAAFLRRTLILEKRATSVPAAFYQGYHHTYHTLRSKMSSPLPFNRNCLYKTLTSRGKLVCLLFMFLFIFPIMSASVVTLEERNIPALKIWHP